MFENFKKVSLTTGLPYMSITDNGVTFSKSVVIKMGKPQFVILLINEEDNQIAIMTSHKDEEDAIAFTKNSKVANVRINNKDLLNTLSKMMGWNLKDGGYKVLGDYYSKDSAMMFDLTKATLIADKDEESDD